MPRVNLLARDSATRTIPPKHFPAMKNSAPLRRPPLPRLPLNALLPAAALLAALPARAWDYEGHRAINLAALSAMPSDFPAFLKTDAAKSRIAFLSGEPDRWYNSPSPSLRHANAGDHFFDIEELDPLGMKFAALPQFRYTFFRQLARAQAAHPELPPKLPPEKDKDSTGDFPGFLPWSIAENYGRLQSAFSYLRAYEQHGGTPAEIANARENIACIMGLMGHLVGDAAQPLHLTMHHHGWVGDNPGKYSTWRPIHRWIDGGFLAKTGPIDMAAFEQRMKPARRLPLADNDPAGRDPAFVQILAYMQAQHAKVEQLYILDKQRKFDAAGSGAKEGRAFLEDQLAAAAAMLANLWYTAYKTAPDDKYLIGTLVKRNTAQ